MATVNRKSLDHLSAFPWILIVLGGLLLASVATAELSPSEARGKRIFLHGTSPSGAEITALMGADQIEVPAAALPCASCHGEDGRGRPEGGIEPSDLTWQNLTKPYGVSHLSGREHPPYTPRFLKRAIAMGIDPAGNDLDLAMPRYRLSQEDMADLVAYIQKLGDDADPGIDDDRLRIGTVLPPAGVASGDRVVALLEAFVEARNAAGGLYGRRLELVVERSEDPLAGFERLLGGPPVFAVVAPMISGAETAVAELAVAREVPVIGPFALAPRLAFPLPRQLFYLHAGLATQARALVRHVVKRSGETPKLVVVHPRDGVLAATAAEAMAEMEGATSRAYGPAVLDTAALDTAALATELSGAGVEAVLFLGDADTAAAFLAAAAAIDWAPTFLAPGSLLGRSAAMAGFAGEIVLAFPSHPGDVTPAGLERYRRLATAGGLPTRPGAVELSALAAVELLAEGLKRIGHEASREKLIGALEGLYAYPTGLTPPLSYGPNRRIGASGAYLVRVDAGTGRMEPLGDFVEVR